MVVNVGGTLKETVKGAVTEIYEDTKTENVKKAVVEVYEDTKNESVTKKVTETFAEGQQTSITGEYDLDVTDAVSIESDSTIKINQPGATQNAMLVRVILPTLVMQVVVHTLMSTLLVQMLSKQVRVLSLLVTLVQQNLQTQHQLQRLTPIQYPQRKLHSVFLVQV